MKRLLFLIVITAMGMFKGHSQALVQTYTDRCTGQVSVFAVPIDGQTVVAFYNRSRTFTAQDFQNGALQSWLEETYLWWSSISPCSSTTTGAQATQQTTQQTTQQATQAATNAVANTTVSTPQVEVPTTTTPPITNTTTNAPSSSISPPSTPETSQTPIADTNTTGNTNNTPDTSSSGTDVSSTGNGSTASTGSEASDATTQPDSTTNETPSSEISA